MSTRDLAPALPAKVQLIYPVRQCSGVPSDGYPKRYVSTVNLSDITLTDISVTPQPLGITGTTKTFRDTALALYSTAGGPASNKATLDALAKQTATDFFDWQSQSFDIVYNGVAAVPPNALVDLLELCYSIDDLRTRIQSQSWSSEVETLQRQDPAISACHADDRNPGVLLDVPGAASGSSMQAVLALEDGRLTLAYDNTTTLACSCTTPACGSICVQVTGCPPTLLASPAIITGASVTVSIQPLASIAVGAGGSSYTSPPTVVIATTNGVGGTAVAVLVGGVVDHIDVLTGGGYSIAPLISFTGGGGGSGASATSALGSSATLGTCTTTGQVTTASVGSPGGSYSVIPTASTSGGGGSGATFAVSMAVDTATPSNGGTGYVVGNSLTVTGGAHSTAAILTVSAVTGGVITAVTVANRGVYTGLATSPAGVTGGAGTGATFNLLWRVQGVAVTGGGSGYTGSTVTLAFSSGSATATGTVRVQCCFPITTIGRYTIVASTTITGYATTTTTVTVSVCATGATPVVNLALASGFSCVANCCPAADYPATPPYDTSIAPPATIFLTDGFGTVTLPEVSPNNWFGCAVRTASSAVSVADCTGATTVSGPVTLGFALSCTGNGSYLLDINADGAPCFNAIYLTTPGSCIGAHSVFTCTGIPIPVVIDCLSFGATIPVTGCSGGITFIYGTSFTIVLSS